MDSTSWQSILSNSVTNVQDILEQIGLKPLDFFSKPTNLTNFPIRISPSFLKKIKPNNPLDPLLLQILPTEEELITHPGYSLDPLNENQTNPVSGIIHKYHSRALITLTGACAINCRYCFRKNFSYKENQPSKSNWQSIQQYIQSTPFISEIILSGGDPLINNDTFLFDFIKMIEEITSIKTLRIHTRVPIVLSERITHEFITMLQKVKLPIVMVIHCNHPDELDDYIGDKLRQLKKIGVTLLNQSVLLKNVNDCSNVLTKLSNKLFSMGVLPYYLHMLDHVSGSHHFFVDEKDAIAIYKKVLETLPGYLVPKLVREEPGTLYKKPLNLF